MILGMLQIISTRLNDDAALVNRETSQYHFFGSHIGRLSGSFEAIGFKHLAPEGKRMIDPVFILRSVFANLGHDR